MKKIISYLFVAVFAVLFSANTLAISLVYDGFACKDDLDTTIATPTQTAIQSKFEVIKDFGGGLFKVSITGGLPRIVTGSDEVCIHTEEGIGYFGDGDHDPSGDSDIGFVSLPVRLALIEADAYVAGGELIIIVNTIYSDRSGRGFVGESTETSKMHTNSYTLIFDIDGKPSFRLTKLIRNSGVISASFIIEEGSRFTFEEDGVEFFDGNYSELVDPTRTQEAVFAIPNVEYSLIE